jgi:hypothetical protein
MTWTLDSGDMCFIKMSERIRTLFNLVILIISDYGKFSLGNRTCSNKQFHHIGFEAVTVMTTKSTVFWDVTPYNLIEVYRCFRGTLVFSYMTAWSHIPEIILFTFNIVYF